METASNDPVLAAFQLPLRRTLFPLGFPLQLQTNSADVVDAAVEAWGDFSQAFEEPPVNVSLGVQDASPSAVSLETVIRSREHLMSITADPNNFVMCDLAAGFAFGWLSPDTVADHPWLRYYFLIPAAAPLIEQRRFAVLHGALVARNGMGVMLAGNSYAGKSTLAYACARSGWTYLSDDATSLVRGRDDCYAAGDRHSIRFRPDAPELFPELVAYLPAVRPNGKIAIEVLTRNLQLETADGCCIEHVVYLNRTQSSAPRLCHLLKDEVRKDWAQYNVFGTERMRQQRRHSYECLLAKPLWEMQYSDLDDAVARLELLVDRGA